MLLVFHAIFVGETKVIFAYNFVASLNRVTKSDINLLNGQPPHT